MNQVVKVLKQSIINYATVSVENGKIITHDCDPIIVAKDNVSEKQALKEIRKANPKSSETFVLIGINETQQVYRMPLEKFISLADMDEIE